MRLINRTSRRLSLTEAGEALHERLRTVLEDVAETEAAATVGSHTPRGRLRINAPLAFGIRHLVPLLPGWHLPDIDVLPQAFCDNRGW